MPNQKVTTATTAPKTGDPSSDRVVLRIEQSIDLIEQATGAALDQTETPDITVIVPVYNEVMTLPKVLARIDEVMPRGTEIIVVDDGSCDGTTRWLQSLPADRSRTIICRRRNHGKGSAVRLAIRHSHGRVVAIQDADLEYDPADLLALATPILAGEVDVVYGSRYLTGSDPSIIHRAGNYMLTAISNRLTGLQLTDMETCHKAFRGDLIRSIPLRECRFGFEPEVTAKLASRGVSICEVATEYQARGYDEGKKIGWRDGLAALACMWKYRRG